MHAKDVMHCDIMPENIVYMTADNDLVKVADFGFAQLLDQGSCILDHIDQG